MVLSPVPEPPTLEEVLFCLSVLCASFQDFVSHFGVVSNHSWKNENFPL